MNRKGTPTTYLTIEASEIASSGIDFNALFCADTERDAEGEIVSWRYVGDSSAAGQTDNGRIEVTVWND